jgi:hypothetical protein
LDFENRAMFQGLKIVRVTDAKEVGVGNPAEETFCHPNVQNIAGGSALVKACFFWSLGNVVGTYAKSRGAKPDRMGEPPAGSRESESCAGNRWRPDNLSGYASLLPVGER